MGVDLGFIIPISKSDTCDISSDFLMLSRNDDGLFDELEKFSNKFGVDIKRSGINCGIGRREKFVKDKYGKIIKSVLAGELKGFFLRINPYIKIKDYQNKAVVAYIKKLPNDYPIYLYWN